MKIIMSLFSLLGLFACGKADYTNLDVEAFAAKTAEPEVAILDVRTADEYAAGHLRGAANIDWYGADFIDLVEKAYPKGTPLAVYCRSGRRSAEASAKLAKAGYTLYNMLGGYLAWTEAGMPVTTYEAETFFTDSGLPVNITLIKHGSLEIAYNGLSIQVDPVGAYGRATDYATEFPKADVILLTHEHGDHFDRDAIKALNADLLITNARCAEMLGYGVALANGDSYTLPGGIALQAVPAYNYTEGHTQFHPKGRDNGFVLDFDGLRIYIAGDTEDIPEMATLRDIDLVFLPVNQPYTMTVEQCVHAATVLAPRVLIPYHFGQTDLSALPSLLPDITVLLRHMQ